MKINDKDVTVKLLDSPGQERFTRLNLECCLTSDGIILVFDITNRASFNKIRSWILNITTNSDSPIKTVLVGNKTDLEDSRVIKKKEAETIAEKYQMKYYEISSKDNKGIDELIESIVSDIINEREKK